MTFTQEEVLWACKAYLLDEYSKSNILRESATESKKFIKFIKNMDIKTAESILEKERYVGSIRVSRFMNDPEELEKLEKRSKALGARIRAAIDIEKREQAAKQTGETAGGAVEQAVKNSLLKKYGVKMAIGALAAALAVIGWMLYKRYSDQCRQSCSKAQNKTKCIKDCRIAGARQSIIHLRTEKGKCGADSKCQKKFDTQISSWEDKMKGLLK